MFCVLISLIDLGVTHMVIMICRYLEKTVTVGRWIFLTEVKIFRNHMPFIVPVWSYKTFFLTRFVMHSTTFRVLKVHFTTFMAYCLTGVLSKPSLLKPSLRFYNRPFIITNGPWYEFSRRLLLRQSNTGTSVHIFRLWQVGLKCFFKDKIHFNESLWGNL